MQGFRAVLEVGENEARGQLADLSEIICLGQTMREFEEQQAKGQEAAGRKFS
jgi:hypothetical protein